MDSTFVDKRVVMAGCGGSAVRAHATSETEQLLATTPMISRELPLGRRHGNENAFQAIKSNRFHGFCVAYHWMDLEAFEGKI